ncbi:NUDIX hydrolase [Streptomyces achromogenes]|uniref:NUDIX hydrolase n=1 Tax=Streptomyces achromogenes TaxID=67255 RepID=UPI0036C4AE03
MGLNAGIEKIVGGAVIAGEDGKVLLYRPADDYLGGLWALPSGGVEPGEGLLDAQGREVAEETGPTVTEAGIHLGHCDYRSGSGRRTRRYDFTASATGWTVTLGEHDAHMWADNGRQTQVSGALQAVLGTWRQALGASPRRILPIAPRVSRMAGTGRRPGRAGEGTQPQDVWVPAAVRGRSPTASPGDFCEDSPAAP